MYQTVITAKTDRLLLGLAAVEAAEGRPARAVAIAVAAKALSERAGIVIEHPMDPGVVSRIDALKASIPKGRLDGIVANATVLSPAAILAMVEHASRRQHRDGAAGGNSGLRPPS